MNKTKIIILVLGIINIVINLMIFEQIKIKKQKATPTNIQNITLY